MGRILSRGLPQGSYPFFHPSVSLFDLGSRFFAPTHTARVVGARRSGSRLAAHWARPPTGLALMAPEHDGILVVVGMTTSEGSSHVVHEHSRHILLFGGPKTQTMMQ
jgi:hypothetical protein